MKSILITFFISIFCINAFSQKLTEPKLLGTWIAGEDASEFMYHRILETSVEYVKDNPDGKLIIRICSPDEFPTAFVKTPLDPLFITSYGFYNLLTSQRFSIARYSKCLYENKYNSSEYWFVTGGEKIEYDEILPIENFFYKEFEIYEFEETDAKNFKNEFDKNLSAFIEELKKNTKSEGFIIHNSKNKKMKRNIEKVLNAVKRKRINVGRIKTVIKPKLDVSEKGELYLVKDENNSFPNLAVIEIKK